MTEERIKKILEMLHHEADHKHWDFDESRGDPWNGYTRNGYEITYNPQTNIYTYEYLFDNGFTNIEYSGAFEISKAELIEKLREIEY